MNSARWAVRMPTAPKMASPTSETTQQFSLRWSETMRKSSVMVSGSVSSEFASGSGSAMRAGVLEFEGLTLSDFAATADAEGRRGSR